MVDVSFRNFTGTGAEHYERFFVPTIAAPISTPVLQVAGLVPGERLLDVACGTGIVGRTARQAGCSVTGVDVSAEMIAVAGAAEPAIDWHVGDAQSLPFEPRSFDVVVCQLGLMFVDDRRKAVAEMHRVLAPGGRVVIATAGPMPPFFEAVERAIADNIGPELGGFVRAVFSMADPDGVAELLSGAGFLAVRTTVESTPLRLPPPVEFLWQYLNLTPMGPRVAAAPDAARAAMERQMEATGAPLLASDGAGVDVDQTVVIATAVRSARPA